MNVIEKVYYTILLSLAFMFYKSPPLMYYVLQENAIISLPTISAIFLLIHYSASYLEKKEKDQHKKHEKLKEKMKDTKR